MIWTQRKPTKAGWWWYRHEKSKWPYKVVPRETIVLIELDRFADKSKELWIKTVSGYRNTVREADGEWSSEPIQEPKEA